MERFITRKGQIYKHWEGDNIESGKGRYMKPGKGQF